MTEPPALAVRGNPTPEEVAAVLAVLACRTSAGERAEDGATDGAGGGYERWRAVRRQALRPRSRS